MNIKILINAIFSIVIFIFQLSFLNSLPLYFHYISAVLITIVFVLSIGGIRDAFWWVIFFGVLADLYSFSVFGVYIISYLTVLFVLNLLLNNFFTNRSLYSFFILTIIAILIFEILSYLLIYLFSFIFNSEFLFDINLYLFIQIIIKIFVNLVAVMLIYYILNFISKKLKPVFLFYRK